MEARSVIAMRNELVIAKVSKHLPVADLAALRQTCTMWNHALLPQLQVTHSPIQLSNPSGFLRSRSLSRFNQLMSSSLEIPFGAYDISNTKDMRSSLSQTLDEFFDVCGNSVRRLAFEFSGNDSRPVMTSFRRALEQGKLANLNRLEFRRRGNTLPSVTTEPAEVKSPLPALPNLKELVLRGTMDSVLVEFLGELLQVATELNSIKIKGGSVNHVNTREFGLLSTWDHAARLGKLRVAALKVADAQTLIELGSRAVNRLQLQSFDAWVCRTEGDDSYLDTLLLLQQFLQTQASTLQTLKIQFRDANGGAVDLPPFHIPKMDHLRAFSLNRLWSSLELRLDGGNMGYNFPRLRKLCIEQPSVDAFKPGDHLQQVAHPRVLEVRMNVDDLSDHMQHWRVWQPCVAHCDLHISTHMRSWDWCAVWMAWPALESLCISYEDLGGMSNGPLDFNEFLSGISASRHDSLRKELANLGTIRLNALRLRGLAERYKTRPGISDLHQLKRFVMKAKVYQPEQTYIWTDIGGYFGLAAASFGGLLQHIELLVEEWDPKHQDSRGLICGEISDHCLDIIRERLGPAPVIEVNQFPDQSDPGLGFGSDYDY